MAITHKAIAERFRRGASMDELAFALNGRRGDNDTFSQQAKRVEHAIRQALKRKRTILTAVAVMVLAAFCVLAGYRLADGGRPRVLCTETTDESGWITLDCHYVPPTGPIYMGRTPEDIEKRWADEKQEQVTWHCPADSLGCSTCLEVQPGTTLRIIATPRNQVKFADWIEKGVRR